MRASNSLTPRTTKAKIKGVTKPGTVREMLVGLGACPEAVKKYGSMTISQAWAASEPTEDWKWLRLRLNVWLRQKCKGPCWSCRELGYTKTGPVTLRRVLKAYDDYVASL